MSYEEFKKELLRTAEEWEGKPGKRFFLLEKGEAAGESWLRNLTVYLNLACTGMEAPTAAEDFLLMLRQECGEPVWKMWNVKECYGKYEEQGWAGVLPDIAAESVPAGHMGAAERAAGAFEYEEWRNRLIVAPLPYELCRKRLNDGVYWRRGEIALALYGLVNEPVESIMTVRIDRDTVKAWGISDNALLSAALFRTCVKLPPRLYEGDREGNRRNLWNSGWLGIPGADQQNAFFEDTASRNADLQEAVASLNADPQEAVASLNADPQEAVASQFAVPLDSVLRLTNSLCDKGAAVLFYPGVKEKLAELLGGDFYASFPSADEARIYPLRHEAISLLRNRVNENGCFYGEESELTDRIYRYNHRRGELMEV